MISNDRLSSATSTALGSDWDNPLRRVRHDLRHALYVSDLALTLLEDSRTDENRFGEVLQMLRKEQATMQSLVDDLLMMAFSEGSEGAKGANAEAESDPRAASLAHRRA